MKLYSLACKFLSLASSEDKAPDSVLLPPNMNQKENAIDLKMNWIIDINPLVFVLMTTADYTELDAIFETAKPLDFYQSEEINRKMTVHPFISVDKNTGKVERHEGRHRAAAIHKGGGKWVRVGMQLSPSGRNHRPDHVPMVWVGQYNSRTYDIKELMNQGKFRVIDDAVQKQYWR